MWNLKACIVCFATTGRFFRINNGQLKEDFHLVSGIKANDLYGLPHYLCMGCSAYVRRFIKFRDKCKRAHFALKEFISKGNELTYSHIAAFDRKSIGIDTFNLTYVDIDKSHYEEVKFQWVHQNRMGIGPDHPIPVYSYNTPSILDDDSNIPNKKQRLSITQEVIKQETEHLKEDISCDILEIDKDENNEQSNEIDVDNYFLDDINSDNDGSIENENCKEELTEADGSNLNQEYATLVPLSKRETIAVFDVYKTFGNGKYRCTTCGKSYNTEKWLQNHIRMHDRHSHGDYVCSLCQMHYKTEFLLNTHMTEKHTYKYLCPKCPEVSFDRVRAKKHYMWTHILKDKKSASLLTARPKWLTRTGVKRKTAPLSNSKTKSKNNQKLPSDFLIYTPVPQEEQYRLVQEKKNSRNYIDSKYRCELCFKGFREQGTLSNHMKKHNPEISGKYQCDMCKIHCQSPRKMYKHMCITHLFKYSCQICDYVVYNKSQAHSHYRWHKNVTYGCPHCDKVFKKMSTRLTHVRIKHPSTNICNICGHSFVSETGLYCHKRLSHSKQEIKASDAIVVNEEDPNYCSDCNVQFIDLKSYQTHLGSSNKHTVTNMSIQNANYAANRRSQHKPAVRSRRAVNTEIHNNGVTVATQCEICGEYLSNDVQARKHYDAEHPGADYLKRYMCDVCGHTTRQYANLLVHMRTHTREKPYGCPHCDRRFSMPSNRDRHIVVHTGEKRYQCQHCSRRFTQSSAVKLHIQTVHLKIPYAPWNKANRRRRQKEQLEATSSVVPPAPCPQPQPKLLLDSQGDYLSAYITYSDD